MGDPMFSEDRTGFIVFDGTASMGAWPLFYKRDSSGNCLQLGSSLQDPQHPLWDNIKRLLQADPTRPFITVKKMGWRTYCANRVLDFPEKLY
jgi:hypothetical protein